MFTGLVHGFRLRRLQATRRRSAARYAKLVREARARNDSPDKLEGLMLDMATEFAAVNEDIAELQTARLVNLAEKFDLPAPKFPMQGGVVGVWLQSKETGKWYLSQTGRLELKNALQQAQKEHRETVQARLIWISMLTGLLGALTGLVSVLHKAGPGGG